MAYKGYSCYGTKRLIPCCQINWHCGNKRNMINDGEIFCHNIYIYIHIHNYNHICYWLHVAIEDKCKKKKGAIIFLKTKQQKLETISKTVKQNYPPLWWSTRTRGSQQLTTEVEKTNFICYLIICNLQQLYKNCSDLFIYITGYIPHNVLFCIRMIVNNSHSILALAASSRRSYLSVYIFIFIYIYSVLLYIYYPCKCKFIVSTQLQI